MQKGLLVFDNNTIAPSNDPYVENTLGQKRYELKNYLGTVNVTVSDRKTYNSLEDAFEATVTNYSETYAFGMLMPNRSFNADGQRHLYHGMEQDMEVSGSGNSYTTEFRQYDPRLGRWKSLDPLARKYPHQSPYAAFNNNPIYFNDPLGLEGEPVTQTEEVTITGKDKSTKLEPKAPNWITGGGDDPVALKGDKAPGNRRHFIINEEMYTVKNGDVYIDKLNNIYKYVDNDTEQGWVNQKEKLQVFDEVTISPKTKIPADKNYYKPINETINKSQHSYTAYKGLGLKGKFFVNLNLSVKNLNWRSYLEKNISYFPRISIGVIASSHATRGYGDVEWKAKIMIYQDGEEFSSNTLYSLDPNKVHSLQDGDFTNIGNTALSLPTSGKVLLKVEIFI